MGLYSLGHSPNHPLSWDLWNYIISILVNRLEGGSVLQFCQVMKHEARVRTLASGLKPVCAADLLTTAANWWHGGGDLHLIQSRKTEILIRKASYGELYLL